MFPFLSDFNYLDIFLKNTQMSKFIKIRPVGAEIFHAERRTGGRTEGQAIMRKLIVAFRGLTNSPEKKSLITRLQREAVSQSSRIVHIL
jgi:hypothetical protein